MKIVNMTAIGDNNIPSENEKTNLEYRKAQLLRLKDEVGNVTVKVRNQIDDELMGWIKEAAAFSAGKR